MKRWPLVAVPALCLGAAVYVGTTSRRDTAKKVPPKPLVESLAQKSANDLRSYIEKNKASSNPATQDSVSSAHIRLAYADAKVGHWKVARGKLLAVTQDYKGTGAMGADYGTIPDQAAYQAAVCLVAEHKDKQAAAEFRSFLANRPESTLVTACYRRLVRLNHGKSDPADEMLLQQAIKKQEATIRFETTVCGPKTIAYLLPKLRPHLSKIPNYKEIAKLCGTSDKGTTITQMRKGLSEIGVPSFGYCLNRRDIASAHLPAIWLERDHYVALLHVNQNKATIFDTRSKAESMVDLPSIDDPDFRVNLILFTQPSLQGR